ncbi:hypothetical protein [Planctomicrobium piriforme]|uniref:Uncharacterized protein n=1 Tax=Planctomicrobium piriforme TaxID=1576369 RepID=A0A1I3C7H5_9PLAN|nr:hypothetical protein [Planctomicrobium piriforme]SFH70099.1 hypothetical protein SAMN05421753_102136 [Planctomicrobium piriforme]
MSLRVTLHRLTLVSLLTASAMSSLSGCAVSRMARWSRPQPSVLEPGCTKQQVLACVNRNAVANETHPVLESWRSGSVRLHVDGVPMALPASVAVQAPSNFRLLVSNPLSGGQEVDIGSNNERFWIWSKEQPQVMTARHEDVAFALKELEMPVHIHPLWLMEVFGVAAVNGDEFEMLPARMESGTVDLVATRESPLGEDVERVVRVNLVQGNVQEHILRMPGGKVLARARLDRYTKLPNGTVMPLVISLEWPDARMKMVMDIRNPEINSPSLSQNVAIWQMPQHGQVVDIGAVARHRSAQANGIAPVTHELSRPVTPGQVRLPNSNEADWAQSPAAGAKATQTAEVPGNEDSAPVWASGTSPATTTPAKTPSATALPSAYSPSASRSSLGPLPPARE